MKKKYKCVNPIDAWVCGVCCAKDGVWSNKLEFSASQALRYFLNIYGSLEAAHFYMERAHLPVDCGKCKACLLRKRSEMSTRLQHERSCHEECCFITLTYNDSSLPKTDMRSWKDGVMLERGDFWGKSTLLPSDVQKFIKRLRRHLEYKPTRIVDNRDHVTKPIRYFAVGEYGTKSRRPHYHIIIFGWRPSDMKVHELRGNYAVCRSAQVEKLWKYGFSTVCDVTGGVVKYCARYVTKKFTSMHSDNVECSAVCPEFVLQSVRNGGIGAPWFDKWFSNLSLGYVTVRADDNTFVKCSIPRYYWTRCRKVKREFWLKLRDERLAFVERNKNHPASYEKWSDFMSRLAVEDKGLREEIAREIL